MYLQNYKIWKQFTTCHFSLDSANLLNVSAKLQNLKAIHNKGRWSSFHHRAECICKITKSESNSQHTSICEYWWTGWMYLQNYKIWKQFTTLRKILPIILWADSSTGWTLTKISAQICIICVNPNRLCGSCAGLEGEAHCVNVLDWVDYEWAMSGAMHQPIAHSPKPTTVSC